MERKFTAYTNLDIDRMVKDEVKDMRKGKKGSVRFQSYVLIIGDDGIVTLQVHCQHTRPNGETWSFARNIAI